MGDSDFKVTDRRASSGNLDDKPTKKGETFVASDPKPGTASEPVEPNQVDFQTLCLSIAVGAMTQLGIGPDGALGKGEKNLELAKQNIQILELLENKTRGNLTPEETQMISNLLTEVRMRFVQATKA